VFYVTVLAVLFSACQSVDDDRIPPYPVSLTFTTIGEWELYGVSGAGQYKRFIFTSTEREPADYPYKGLDRTGFGGILLLCDPQGSYIAYDLACPVEVKSDVHIDVDCEAELAGIARCPVCHSTYNLYGAGAPLSGDALSKNYGLQRYNVRVGASSSPYAAVTR